VPRASVAGDFTTALGRLGDAQRAVVDDLLEFGVHPSKASVRALGILTRHPQGVQAARVFLAFARASDNLGPAWVLDRLLHLEDDPLGRWTADPQLWTHYHAPPAETPVNWTAYAFQTCRDTLSRFDFTAPRCADLVSRLAGCFELTEEMPRVVWWMVEQAAASPVPRATIEHQVERVTRDPLAAEVARAFVPDLDAVPPDAHALAVYWRDYLKTHPTLTMCLPPAVTESAAGGPHVHSSAYAVARHSTADADPTVGELDGADQEGRDP